MCFSPLVGEFSAFSARLSRRERGNSAAPPQSRGIMSVVFMVVSQLGLELRRDENVVPAPDPFTARRLQPYAKNAATRVHDFPRWSQLDTHTMDIFTQDKPKEDFSKAVKANHHIYDYVNRVSTLQETIHHASSEKLLGSSMESVSANISLSGAEDKTLSKEGIVTQKQVHNCFTLVFFKLFANNLGCYHYYPGVNHVRRHPFQN
jgi:hypothetical protein